MPTRFLLRQCYNKAAALIIVLAFVVLLTGLALAYFTGTTIERQLAHSSHNDTSSDLLARSALDIVVADFKQEMVNGSISPAPISGVLVPSQASYLVPQRNIPTPIPNLIRISISGDPGVAAPAVGSRASAVNSTNNPSANGRSISTARWNSHYLIPLGSPSPFPETSPTPSFTPPDWVIVTRAGPAPFTSGDLGTLADASPTNANYAIGRYAYAVYDEGGLLDMNMVGYPTPAPSPINEFTGDLGRKGVPAMIDVGMIIPTPTPIGTPFMQGLVGFRNYATTQQSNVSNLNFPHFVPNIDIFINYVLGSPIGQPHIGTTRDYGTINNATADSGTRTDQSFVTRAELIKFVQTLGNQASGVNVNALQYMGTFSREQNKPNLPLTPAWPFTRVVLPQRFYLGNLNLVVYPSPTPTPIVTPTPTATPTLTPTILTSLGLQFVSAASPTPTPPPPTPTATPTPSPCIGQVRWEYVGNQSVSGTPTPLPFIPAFPSDLSTLDFFQYINYALFGRTDNDSADIAYTLGIGAALIDQYDAENTFLTGIYYGSSAATCDPGINADLVFGTEQSGTTVRSQAPTGIPPPPSPDPLTGFVPSINSPTRTVGEFGWAYSILNAATNRNATTSPKYLIDFKDAYDANSNPDPALLDFFTYSTAPVRFGVVSLNTRQAPVLAAILRSAYYQGTANVLNPTQAPNAANSIVASTRAVPAMSRADIARFPSVVNSPPFGNGGGVTQDIKDTFARALSELTQTRTWGLLIDLVAQTGHYKPNAQGLAEFVVEGEKRYWLHVAIDRFDGTIVGQQLEEVTE